MKTETKILEGLSLPPLLHEIPDPPQRLYLAGTLPPDGNKLLAVVGSRKYSSYGREVVEHLIGGLRSYPISIVSGLAIGIDALAHKKALACGLHTVALPGSGLSLNTLYPAQNRILAKQILKNGGALLSEFDDTFEPSPWGFPQRNRIMAGISHATLVVEGTERSGTLITARLACEYNRELLVVPGSIFSGNSVGPHLFLKLGATPVTTSADILNALNINIVRVEDFNLQSLSKEERAVLSLLTEPRVREDLLRAMNIDLIRAQTILSKMELAGLIEERGGVFKILTT